MKNELATIKSNKNIGGNFWHCVVRAKEIARNASAGQFVNIKLDSGFDPLLRRPFSIHKVSGQDVEILFEVVGRGTGILSKMKPGEVVDIIGPLGNGFDILPTKANSLTLLVAGGMGSAPLVFLAEKIVGRKGKTTKLNNVLVLIGARNKNQITCEDEFKRLGCKVVVATDDGSRGFKGRVTDLLGEYLRHESLDRGVINQIYACGPVPMLKKLCLLAEEYGVLAQVSLEEHMSCGIGACLGCVIETHSGYKRVCYDGPVFMADEIIWRE